MGGKLIEVEVGVKLNLEIERIFSRKVFRGTGSHNREPWARFYIKINT